MRAWVLFFVAAATAAAAGPVSFGVKGGIPLTDFFTAVNSQSFSFSSTPKRYVVGGAVELKLPVSLSIELDALYRRMDYAGSASSVTQNFSANGFEFPLLLKYKLPSVIARPFVDAGFAFDTLSGLTQTVASKTGLTSAPPSAKTTKGFVMGGGLDFNLKILHIAPEIRYTHWGSSRLVDPLSLVTGSRNQAEFLLGITF
jgi:hypothetical protein